MNNGSVGESAAASTSRGRNGAGIAIVVSSASTFVSVSDLFRPASSAGGGLDLELNVLSVKPIEP